MASRFSLQIQRKCKSSLLNVQNTLSKLTLIDDSNSGMERGWNSVSEIDKLMTFKKMMT